MAAVVLNLTGVYPTSQTHLTLWPYGETRPTACFRPLGATSAEELNRMVDAIERFVDAHGN